MFASDLKQKLLRECIADKVASCAGNKSETMRCIYGGEVVQKRWTPSWPSLALHANLTHVKALVWGMKRSLLSSGEASLWDFVSFGVEYESIIVSYTTHLTVVDYSQSRVMNRFSSCGGSDALHCVLGPFVGSTSVVLVSSLFQNKKCTYHTKATLSRSFH